MCGNPYENWGKLAVFSRNGHGVSRREGNLFCILKFELSTWGRNESCKRQELISNEQSDICVRSLIRGRLESNYIERDASLGKIRSPELGAAHKFKGSNVEFF
jgi:hypothetical protein